MMEKTVNTLREEYAALVHDMWIGWMKHLETKIVDQMNFPARTKFKGFYFEKDDLDRWKRQMETEYKDLSEKEKKSDREIADKFMKLLFNDNDNYSC